MQPDGLKYRCHACGLQDLVDPHDQGGSCRRCSAPFGKKFPCQACGLEAVVVLTAERFRCERCAGQAFVTIDHANFEARPYTILSTGDIPHSYKITNLVFAYGNSSSFLGGLSVEDAYARSAHALGLNALRLGADGVIFIRFEYRVAAGATIPLVNITQRIFEIFSYGTAVKVD